MKNYLGLGGLVLLMSMSMIACGSRSEGGESNTEGEVTSVVSETSEEKIDYGKVYFRTMYIYADQYGNNFDDILIRPLFTKPEVCQNEVFEYEVSNEDICYVENGRVYATGINGNTKITAKSQHLKGQFYVYSSSSYANGGAFGTAKSLANTASKATNQGTTLFVGDSFWEFWRNKTGIDRSFAQAFSGYDVANVGISGTQAREWRSLRGKLIDPYKPANLVLNIGINDVDDNSEDGETTAEYIMTLCNDIWDTNPNCNIYYCSITRCSGFFAGKWPVHEQSNTFMKANAENNEKLHYLDIMEKYGDKYADYEQDGLHPNTAGYALIEEVIKANVPLKTK